ncbi:haloacid dehalogenase [Alicyclobacillus contaminans]|uniref:HAD family hydrolase n=1 Tax=Alicyclobacillus contaminans TaxID=392016 RepID=UPI000424B1F0|nr:HAD hydrolase-like protein [Alicyclobacillus contaminans]GMA49731.1 haloacid dehalogenase [Alicyclobacillus contaminans]
MYSVILFDIDGVMLSEERYFDASALTVHELLSGSSGLGLVVRGLPAYQPVPPETDIRTIRRVVFAEDRVLDTMKSAGVNANWDMVYLQFMAQWLHCLRQARQQDGVWSMIRALLAEPTWDAAWLARVGAQLRAAGLTIDPAWFADFCTVYGDCKHRAGMFAAMAAEMGQLLDVPADALTDRLHHVYDHGVSVFQAWYLGDAYNEGAATGKTGFVQQEIPLVPPAELAKLFAECQARGARLGVATGRPQIETDVPFSTFGWSAYFTPDHITTASRVRAAEQRFPDRRPLSKPNPFSYVRSWLGTTDEAALVQPLPLPKAVGDSILIVGDSVADWQAARAMGCHFAATLTGLTGERARATFEQLGCEYILDNVLELPKALRWE